MLISESDVLTLNSLCERLQSNLPSVDSSKDYWFVRAQKGLFYKSFLSGGYIAIGWNHITFDDLENLDEESVKSKVKTTRENGWLALRLKASATGRGLKAYRMVSLQHHLC